MKEPSRLSDDAVFNWRWLCCQKIDDPCQVHEQVYESPGKDQPGEVGEKIVGLFKAYAPGKEPEEHLVGDKRNTYCQGLEGRTHKEALFNRSHNRLLTRSHICLLIAQSVLSVALASIKVSLFAIINPLPIEAIAGDDKAT